MAKFQVKEVSGTIERNLLTAAIISTKFLEDLQPIYNPAYIKNTYAKTVMSWVWDFFERFEKAPGQTMQSIYDMECATLDEEDAGIIKKFLASLSKNYVEGQGVNDDYIFEQVMEYFRKREVEIRVDNAQKYLQIGKLEKAEDELFQMKKVMRTISKWSNPFDVEMVHEVFDESKKGILKLPGALGDFIGELERGWLIAYLAPFKRGKTHFLQEALVQAAFSGLKGVFISCEMKNKNINERLYKRMTAYGDGTEQQIPVFDCVKNQMGTCSKGCRTNQVTLYFDDETPPVFSPDLKYRACCVCKETGDFDYQMAGWYEMMDKKEFNFNNVGKKIKAIRKMFGDNIRTKCYPRFSASVSDIRRDLDILEQVDGFIPDIIVIDYAGILRPDKGSTNDPRLALDEIWKSLAAMAAERSAVVFTASQGNRASIYKDNMDQTDLAEHIGILGHVDKLVAINQSGEEKKRNIIRIGMLADRHKEYHEKDTVFILQSLSLGQTHLDSYLARSH